MWLYSFSRRGHVYRSWRSRGAIRHYLPMFIFIHYTHPQTNPISWHQPGLILRGALFSFFTGKRERGTVVFAPQSIVEHAFDHSDYSNRSGTAAHAHNLARISTADVVLVLFFSRLSPM